MLVIAGEQMIGYGPDISDDKGTGRRRNDEDPDFHPLPPPITKGTVGATGCSSAYYNGHGVITYILSIFTVKSNLVS